jgi:hypothetical protein
MGDAYCALSLCRKPPDMPMRIEDWLAEERARLDRFRMDWLRNHAEDPERWPNELPEASDWDEAYHFFEG